MTKNNYCKKGCPDCIPSVKYPCSKHRPENLCMGCLRTDKPLYASGIGILCKDCQRKNGVIFA